VTTVGYGDIVPDQTAGKVIGGFLMLGGLSLLAVVAAAITSGFVSRAQAAGRTSRQESDPVIDKLNELAVELQAVKAELEQLRSGQWAQQLSVKPSRASGSERRRRAIAEPGRAVINAGGKKNKLKMK
jgi:ribosomal protein L29